MSSEENNKPVGFWQDQENYAVVLPCEPPQFGDFIANLLGRPQVISGYLNGPFEVMRKDIESLYFLVNQRVFSQNNATNISFNITISYDDGSSVTLNSYEDFLSYGEIKPLLSNGVHLSWILLIQFQDKKSPEKQQIDVTYSTGDKSQFDDAGIVEFPRVSTRTRSDSIYYRISHTNRTWGTDIQGLISSHLSLSLKPLGGVRSFIANNCGKLGFLLMLLVLAISIAGGIYITGIFVDKYLSEAVKLSSLPKDSSQGNSEKLDFLVHIIATGLWSRYSFYATIYAIFVLVISLASWGMAASAGDFIKPSFVLLTTRAEAAKDKYDRKINNDAIAYFALISGSLCMSLLGSYVFYALSKYFNLS